MLRRIGTPGPETRPPDEPIVPSDRVIQDMSGTLNGDLGHLDCYRVGGRGVGEVPVVRNTVSPVAAGFRPGEPVTGAGASRRPHEAMVTAIPWQWSCCFRVHHWHRPRSPRSSWTIRPRPSWRDALNPRNLAVRQAARRRLRTSRWTTRSCRDPPSRAAISGTARERHADLQATPRAPDLPGVQVIGDKPDEWFPTLQQDEVFFLQLSNPSANATILKGRGTINLMDDDHDQAGEYLGGFRTALPPARLDRRANRCSGESRAAPVQPVDMAIRWNTGPSCTFPSSTTAGAGTTTGGIVAAAGAVQTWHHNPSATLNPQYCYSVLTIYGAGSTTEIAQVETTLQRDGYGRMEGLLRRDECRSADRRRGRDLRRRQRRHRPRDAAWPCRRAWPTGWNPAVARQAGAEPLAGRTVRVPPPLGAWRFSSAPIAAGCTPSTASPAS